ncbi:Nucleolar protein 19 [Spathaspora sp. JA1]|nr:Nucleolar protein 19 [Spathaspora sp. JA1]
MSKNRRKEIQEKQSLQAQFQLALSQNEKRALSWLQPCQQPQEQNTVANTNDDDSFMNLPVIPQGAGLTSGNSKNTIGEFLSSDDLKKNKPQPGNEFRKTAVQSKPMIALMNKMRNTSREKVRKKVERVKQQTRENNQDNDDSEDEEVSELRARSVKKTTTGLLHNKIKKKSGRPF